MFSRKNKKRRIQLVTQLLNSRKDGDINVAIEILKKKLPTIKDHENDKINSINYLLCYCYFNLAITNKDGKRDDHLKVAYTYLNKIQSAFSVSSDNYAKRYHLHVFKLNGFLLREAMKQDPVIAITILSSKMLTYFCQENYNDFDEFIESVYKLHQDQLDDFFLKHDHINLNLAIAFTKFITPITAQTATEDSHHQHSQFEETESSRTSLVPQRSSSDC